MPLSLLGYQHQGVCALFIHNWWLFWSPVCIQSSGVAAVGTSATYLTIFVTLDPPLRVVFNYLSAVTVSQWNIWDSFNLGSNIELNSCQFENFSQWKRNFLWIAARVKISSTMPAIGFVGRFSSIVIKRFWDLDVDRSHQSKRKPNPEACLSWRRTSMDSRLV